MIATLLEDCSVLAVQFDGDSSIEAVKSRYLEHTLQI